MDAFGSAFFCLTHIFDSFYDALSDMQVGDSHLLAVLGIGFLIFSFLDRFDLYAHGRGK